MKYLIKYTILFFSCQIICAPLNSHAQTFQAFSNLDFERLGTLLPWTQGFGHDNYEIELNTKDASHGSQSLMIKCLISNSQVDSIQAGFATTFISFQGIKIGKSKIIMSVDVKPQNITHGIAFVAGYITGNNGQMVLSKDLMQDSIHGSTDWKTRQLDFDVDSTMSGISIVCYLYGTGSVLFDNIRIAIDGHQYNDGVMPNIPTCSPSEREFLRSHINNFTLADKNNDFEHFDPFINRYQIIGVGECTHGTHEFEIFKAEFIKYCLLKKGFTAVGLEANCAETEHINDYIHGSNDNIDTLMKYLRFWCWNTQELKDLILWIRDYNHSSRNKVCFFGFDMQFESGPLNDIEQILSRQTAVYKKSLLELCRKYREIISKLSFSDTARNSPHALFDVADSAYTLFQKNSYIGWNKKRLDDDKIKLDLYLDNLRQLAKYYIELQYNNRLEYSDPAKKESKYYFVRDSCMFINIKKQISRFSNAKTILWAHNGHIAKDAQTMGEDLSKEFSNKYACIGQFFNQGSYNAVYEDNFLIREATPSYPGSFESLCSALSNKPFFLDFNSNTKLTNLPKCILESFDQRDVGFSAVGNEFSSKKVTALYDAITYFPMSSPSSLINNIPVNADDIK